MRAGLRTVPASVPGPEVDERAGIAEARELLQRLATRTGALQPSPFFGDLTPDQWRELHLIHCAHHLGFFEPVNTTAWCSITPRMTGG